MESSVFICVIRGWSFGGWMVASRVEDNEPVGVIGRLMRELGKLPGIGPKSAERLAHHLLGASNGDVIALADALRAVKEQIHPCPDCCNPTESDRCSICSDPRRD